MNSFFTQLATEIERQREQIEIAKLARDEPFVVNGCLIEKTTEGWEVSIKGWVLYLTPTREVAVKLANERVVF